jgi:hypothetical protein
MEEENVSMEDESQSKSKSKVISLFIFSLKINQDQRKKFKKINLFLKIISRLIKTDMLICRLKRIL